MNIGLRLCFCLGKGAAVVSCWLIDDGNNEGPKAVFEEGFRRGIDTTLVGLYSFSSTHSSGTLQQFQKIIKEKIYSRCLVRMSYPIMAYIKMSHIKIFLKMVAYQVSFIKGIFISIAIYPRNFYLKCRLLGKVGM